MAEIDMEHILFKDLAQDIVCSRPVRYIITDHDTNKEYKAADATHAVAIIQSLVDIHVTESMFYTLRSKSDTKAGVLRYRFTSRRPTK